ncbi:unnamed protein product, partial [Brassica oleracea var. botrytis]
MGIGASSRKRKTQQTKPPLARRKLNLETGTSARVATSNRRKPASSKDTKAASGGHSSDSQPISIASWNCQGLGNPETV